MTVNNLHPRVTEEDIVVGLPFPLSGCMCQGTPASRCSPVR